MPLDGGLRDLDRDKATSLSSYTLEEKDSSIFSQSAVNYQTYNKFRGKIVIRGCEISFPIQNLVFFEEENRIFIQNEPNDNFPRIEFVSIIGSNEFVLTPKPSKTESVESEVVYTRFILSLLKADSYYLQTDTGKVLFELKVSDQMRSLSDDFEYRAKLFRKLQFIERRFKTKFFVPSEISWRDAMAIETVFRGFTEGTFSMPAGKTINLPLDFINSFDLTKPPFSEHGEFDFTLPTDKETIFGKDLEVGKRKIVLKRAGLANPRVLKEIKSNSINEDVKIIVFDHQIQCTFEKHLDKVKLSRNKQELRLYKNYLRKFESEFIVSLVDDLLSRIPSETATDIVEGLLQFYNFPNHFSVLEPELKENQWRVPIVLTYSANEPIWLEDALVDVKTGKVKIEISFNELLKKGKRKAKGFINSYSPKVDLRPIWEIISEISNEVPEEEWEKVPSDGSICHDHYLYGAPKKY